MDYSDKQLHIMLTAELLFAEQGFHGTSVRDIADKAQVNLAMVSYYFGSKEKLLEALFEYRSAYITLKLEHIYNAKEGTSIEKVFAVIDAYIDKIVAQPHFSKILSREQVLLHTGKMQNLILNMKQRNHSILQKIISDGQKKGEFRKDVDIPLLMVTFFGTVNHMMVTQHYYKTMHNLSHYTDEQFRTYIQKKLSQHLKNIFNAIVILP